MASPDPDPPGIKDITHWIFDMDGTLTLAVHDFDEIRRSLGLPVGKPILEEIDKHEPAEALRIHQKLDDMEMKIASETRVQPGAIELLDHLANSGKHVGILTRNGKEIAHVTLAAAGIDHFFDPNAVVSRNCCTAKPDPAGVHLLLDRWQTSADKAIMVGDYRYDLEAGSAAGTSTVHMDVSGEFAWPTLTTYSVKSLGALLGLLTS